MESNSEILTSKEAAILLGAHVETIRRMARKGELPTYKIGKDWRYSKKALLQWAETHHLRHKPPCVLIVDDDDIICHVVRDILKPTGHQVLIATDGYEGFSLLAKETVDLVLLDLNMPGMTGPEFLQQLRKSHPAIPVIIITGFPDSALMMEAYHYGPLLLVPKPIEIKLLLGAVDIALNGTMDSRAGSPHAKAGT
jgi:excisionase family DNA binding protein